MIIFHLSHISDLCENVKSDEITNNWFYLLKQKTSKFFAIKQASESKS